MGRDRFSTGCPSLISFLAASFLSRSLWLMLGRLQL